jgi:hypothetical protein
MSRPPLEQRYRVSRDRFRIAEHAPADTAGLDRKRARELQAEDHERLAVLQKRLFAEHRQALLVRVTAFKRPSPPELAHDHHKWMARTAVAQIVVHHLQRMDPRYPAPGEAAGGGGRGTCAARGRGRVRRILPAAAVVVALASITGAGTSAAATPNCFGAAARDREHPCVNRTRSAVPTPDEVSRISISYCAPMRKQRDPQVCTFGARAAKASAHVALVGDSHALQWRTALDVAARAERWHAYSITTPGCFYSAAVFSFPLGLRDLCTSWFGSVTAWFRRHPEVSTVFVSQNAPTPIDVVPGQTVLGVKADGFRRAWSALPRTVKHVVVIRDTPFSSAATFACVRRVLAAGAQRPGPACPIPRSAALHRDGAVSAALALRSQRYGVVDMTDFFCGSRSCYPVIGGVLVHRDTDHIGVVYSRTLGPYLLRKVRRLMGSWRRGRVRSP